MNWPFDPLRMFGYDIVVVDPPTEFKLYSESGEEKSAAAQYDIMSWSEIEALPVGHLARCNAVLLLWACSPTLRKSLALMDAWGAYYKTDLVWRKVTKNGIPRMSTGYRNRNFHEHILVGVFGDERQIHDAFRSLIDGIEDPRDGQMFDGVAREHSRKPDEFYADILARTPGLDRCDVFARYRHEGFDGWGREYGKFDEVAA